MNIPSDLQWHVQTLLKLKCACCYCPYNNPSLRDEWELPPLHPSPFSTGELLIASYIQRVSYSQDSKNKGKQNTSDSGEQKPGEKSLNFIWRKGSVTFGAASWQQVNILVHCFSMVWEDAKGEIIHGTSNHIKFL